LAKWVGSLTRFKKGRLGQKLQLVSLFQPGPLGPLACQASLCIQADQPATRYQFKKLGCITRSQFKKSGLH